MKKKIAEKVRQNLMRALLSGRATRREAVIGSLLTTTEKTMIAKRLAMIILLVRGMTHYRIAKLLGVSTSTTRRLHRELLAGSFLPIQQMIVSNQDYLIIEMIEKILQFRMPPMSGPGRWKFLKHQ